jgi:hypothetical protein
MCPPSCSFQKCTKKGEKERFLLSFSIVRVSEKCVDAFVLRNELYEGETEGTVMRRTVYHGTEPTERYFLLDTNPGIHSLAFGVELAVS